MTAYGALSAFQSIILNHQPGILPCNSEKFPMASTLRIANDFYTVFIPLHTCAKMSCHT